MQPRCALFGLALVVVLGACGRAPEPTPATRSTPVSAPAASTVADASPTRTATQLRMRIDGVEWRAAHDLFGAVNPTGHDRAVIIAGSRGGKSANEQSFNLTLLGVDAPGRHRVTSERPASGAAQISNLDAQRFLAGNLFGYDLEVELLRRSTNPDLIEARFSGSLTANDGSQVAISDGHFVYTGTD
ncbi:MAG: hypothetical protein J0L88_02460 [Xanthomonadales bacterium]|nr:hypothetical protein [Xanthomonadales bacterium]